MGKRALNKRTKELQERSEHIEHLLADELPIIEAMIIEEDRRIESQSMSDEDIPQGPALERAHMLSKESEWAEEAFEVAYDKVGDVDHLVIIESLRLPLLIAKERIHATLSVLLAADCDAYDSLGFVEDWANRLECD
jgi:hypothetical protein